MRYGELFAGAGGMSLGLERAGLACAFHAEIADKPRDILGRRWPDAPLYGDVAQLDGRALVDAHGAIDLLAGGSPCQDMSVAGKRAGLAGARSGLFYEQLRLWNETAATYLLWENVAGALSSNAGADFAAVLSAIVGGAVHVPSDGWRGAGVVSGPGAVAAWRLLDAQWFGVPQRRLRVFVLGARAGGVDPAEVLLEPQGVRRHPPTRGEAGQGSPCGAGERADGSCFNISHGEARESGVAATLATAGGANRHHADWSATYMTAVLAFDWQKGNDVSNVRPSTMNVTEEQTGTLAATRVPAVLAITGDVTHALTHEGHDASEDGTGRGTPIVCASLTAGCGELNGRDAENGLLVVGTLRSTDGGLDVDHAAAGHVLPGAGIPRRLMPVECERLMSWPDGWTDVPDAKGKPASDAARYKACGNGVVSNVAQWIGERLVSCHSALVPSSPEPSP